MKLYSFSGKSDSNQSLSKMLVTVFGDDLLLTSSFHFFLFYILAVALGLAASGAYAKKSRSYESRGYEEAPRRQRRSLGQSESSHRDVERSTNQRAEESSPGLFDLASMEANLKTLVKAISAAATGRAPRDQG